MIVVDTNILAYLYLPSDKSEDAERLLRQDAHWAAPALWRSEFRNILAGFMRKNLLTFEQSDEVQTAAEALMQNSTHDVDSRTVLSLVHQSDCSAYDCEFVALAMRLHAPLFTLDKKLLKAFPQHARSLSTLH